MIIYQPLVSEGYEWVNTSSYEDGEKVARFDGTRLGNGWAPIRVLRVKKDGRQKFKPSDFPWLGSHALVMRRSAVDALRELLDANGEVLPLATEDDVELFIYNAQVVDGLDEAQSTIDRLPGTDLVLNIKKPAFVPSTVRGLDLFRVPYRAMPTYVSERFVERYNSAGLRGLDLNEVWSGA